MSDRAWKLSGGWCDFSLDPQIDMVQGFIVYSRIDNILGCGAPANPTRTIYTEEMICTAGPRRVVASGPIFVTPSHFLSPESFCWRPQSAEMNLHQTSLKHFSTAILVDHSMACSFIRCGAIQSTWKRWLHFKKVCKSKKEIMFCFHVYWESMHKRQEK